LKGKWATTTTTTTHKKQSMEEQLITKQVQIERDDMMMVEFRICESNTGIEIYDDYDVQ
jgi:hypothetical protein